MKMTRFSLLMAGAVALSSPLFAAETDYTSAIVNPSFETNDLSGWTNRGFQKQTNNSPADAGWQKDGNVYAEKWVHENNRLDNASLFQTVENLPSGDYILRAVGHSISQKNPSLKTKGTYLYTGTNETLVNEAGEYEVKGTVCEGKLLIGFKTVSTDANWAAIDNFRLIYVGESVEGYRQYLDLVVAELKETFKKENCPPVYNENEIAAAFEAAEKADTKETIFAAIEALRTAEKNFNNALSEARETEFCWGRMKSEIKIAEMFYADSDYEGKADFRKAIDEAKKVYEEDKDPVKFDDAILKLKEASALYKANRPSEWVRIKNGAMWKDTDGNDVQAHAPGFVLLNDRYYMIGEDRSDQYHPDVNMYSSKDLVNWKFERKIIENNVTHPDLGKVRFIERPKILYNPKTGKFVVWCHWESENYSASEAGVLYADVVNDPYTYYSGERPLGVPSRDCNVYVDDDGQAYFVSTIEFNKHLGFFRLSDDYLKPLEYTQLFNDQRREAPAIVRHEGRYYMLSSACSGWNPNQCQLSFSDKITEGWSSLKKVGNPIAFDTQPANILKVEGTKATTYLFVGDRWMDPDLRESKTIIFPVSFTENNCKYEYLPEFEINFVTGEWRMVESTEALDKTGWSVLSCSSEETTKEKAGAANVFDGNTSTIWHTRYSAEPGIAPHHISIDMGKAQEISGFMAVPRNDVGSINGLIREFKFEVSVDGEYWKTVSAGDWMPYWAEISFPTVEARYFRITAPVGEHASLAEVEIFKNMPAYDQKQLKNYYKVGNGSWIEGSEINVKSGESVTFGPNHEAPFGTWATVCPDGTILPGREVTVENVTSEKTGVYQSLFVDMYNNSHVTEYTVKLDANNVKALPEGVETVSCEYVTLSGIRVSETALTPGLYIRTETLSDGSVRTSKVLVR